MTYDQCRKILDNLKQMDIGLNCIVVELDSDRIIGRKTSFEYLDFQIDSLRELIQETAEIANKELES